MWYSNVEGEYSCIHPPVALTSLTASFMSLSKSSETVLDMLVPWAAPEVFPSPFLMVLASYNVLSVLSYTALTR